LSNNIRPILERDDRVPLDSYIRNLPMAYDHAFDRKETRRSRFVFARHIANLLPLYGRSTGTGKPGMLFFNRGGEPVQFDPIADRKSKPIADLRPDGFGQVGAAGLRPADGDGSPSARGVHHRGGRVVLATGAVFRVAGAGGEPSHPAPRRFVCRRSPTR